MKQLILIFVFGFSLLAHAQEGGDPARSNSGNPSAEQVPNPEAIRSSQALTAEANEDLADSDFVQAEAKFRRAIAKSEANSAAPYNLGNAYYTDGSYGEAFGRYKEAGDRAGAKGDKHKAYHNMGNVYMQQKQYQNAVEAYKESLRNDPTDEETRYNLALAKEMLKKEQEEQKQDDGGENEQEQQDQDQQDQQDSGDEDDAEDKENQEGDNGESDKAQEGESEDDMKKEEEEKKSQNQDEKQDSKDQPKPSDQQPRPNQLSKEQIANLLQAMENEEKKVKEKIDAQKIKGGPPTTEKDW
ncbi:TPR repeat-containing protein [Robiginitalea myxolifaciens]|uniref:TPR repeat-containing protein n=1 Tax=Robiginitalea myxolifaciens TaxID=400055 RepID=A0A1I6G5B9_9FLAO|nr:tetratricopeptide repeat protein [Robiginitalea myxolifaciens]SFR37394.1 TPR repeat-containing protein [Robiginitalea myxolifaciens]